MRSETCTVLRGWKATFYLGISSLVGSAETWACMKNSIYLSHQTESVSRLGLKSSNQSSLPSGVRCTAGEFTVFRRVLLKKIQHRRALTELIFFSAGRGPSPSRLRAREGSPVNYFPGSVRTQTRERAQSRGISSCQRQALKGPSLLISARPSPTTALFPRLEGPGSVNSSKFIGNARETSKKIRRRARRRANVVGKMFSLEIVRDSWVAENARECLGIRIFLHFVSETSRDDWYDFCRVRLFYGNMFYLS